MFINVNPFLKIEMGTFTRIKEESFKTFFDLVKVSLKNGQEAFNNTEAKGEAIKQQNRKNLRRGEGYSDKDYQELRSLGITFEQTAALHTELHPKLDTEFNKIAATLKDLKDHWDSALSGRETTAPRRRK